MSKTHTVAIRFSTEMHDILSNFANAEEMPVAQLIRKLVKKSLVEHGLMPKEATIKPTFDTFISKNAQSKQTSNAELTDWLNT